MRIRSEDKLRGLHLTVKLGEIINVNKGEMLIQPWSVHGKEVRLVIHADRMKYDVVRENAKKRNQEVQECAPSSSPVDMGSSDPT